MKSFLEKLILNTFAFVLVLINHATAQVFDFSKTPKIRVYISAAPGLGHQSASVVVMRRLRQLGFNGEFEVIYADTIANKLPVLLPGFDAQEKGLQQLEHLKIQTISESYFFAQTSIDKVELAVTGADDNRTHITPEKIRSSKYLLMEPLGWGESFLLQENRPVQPLTSLRSLGYYFETDSSPEGLENTLESIKNEGQAARALGLRSLLHLNAHFGAIYGVGTIPQVATKLKTWVQAIERAGRSSKLKKPIILPIISPLNKFEQLTLQDTLEDIIIPNSAKNRVRIAMKDLADLDFQSYIQTLKSGDVLLVNVGRVPQTIFERLFSISDIPVLVAGKNAMNLSQNLGKVYLNTVQDSSLPNSVVFSEARNQSQAVHKIFSNAGATDRDLRYLAQFIKEGLDPNSDVSKMHQSFQETRRDKVAEALRLLRFPEVSASCGAIFK